MNELLKRTKDIFYYYVVEKNENIRQEYTDYVNEHIQEHDSHRLEHWKKLLQLNIYYRIKGGKGRGDKPLQLSFFEQPVKYYEDTFKRLSADELTAELEQYDVISFDIFDTALYRKVEFPNDVFAIMAVEMGHNDFENIRKKAEQEARELKEKFCGTREVVLSEIYDILESQYNIKRHWEQREIELEMELSEANPYIFTIYQHLLELGKTIVFMSDMYLPEGVIEDMLKKNGYQGYSKLYLSNKYGLRKGDGQLQLVFMEDYKGKRLVHIGDMKASDIDKSREVGLDAIYNPAPNLSFREGDMDNLAGSFYRSIINRKLNNGIWDESLHYEHGFRVGGILATGFCQYINQLVEEKHIDKILFCARDCEIIWKIYNRFYPMCDNEYVQISRYSIMNVTSERYLYDLSNRYILRYFDQNRTTKTIDTILQESGFGYLAAYLDEDDIERFAFPAAIDRKVFERFVFRHRNIIKEHNLSSERAAEQYFKAAIGNAKNILVVDIGWSGTCITALKYFIEQHFPQKKCQIFGALMCTSRNKAVAASFSDGTLFSYIYSPFQNADLARFMMPKGRSVKEQDMLHMPLEFLFTSADCSLVRYKQDTDGAILFERVGNPPANQEEIGEMQNGMMDFAALFKEVSSCCAKPCMISPYVAFNPLAAAIRNSRYCYEVYKNFTYDAFTAPFSAEGKAVRFETLFDDLPPRPTEAETVSDKGKILFVTPELTYTGTPRSLLRMCKVAVSLGYAPIVWSSRPGPFATEYEKYNIEVQIVPETSLSKREIINRIKSCDMAVCNTIMADRYARVCSFYVPTVWYIREATNIPDFTRNNPQRFYTLQHSRDIYCVSDYAAAAISQFTSNKITVVHNCVEDESDMAVPYTPGTAEKIRFVQFGTMEYRKGYDVLLSAYLSMPEDYRKQAELYFAGGFINSGMPYCAYLFSKMKNEPNVHYLGIVRGEENKISTLSQMDVVVVASRDESCSLVALEGAMLSKPLIVTENVGAKYMVSAENGFIVKTADVKSLKNALMSMIDKRTELAQMGRISRQYYEKYASMDSYTDDMKKMFALTEEKDLFRSAQRRIANKIRNHVIVRELSGLSDRNSHKHGNSREDVIVSLTSHPGRIGTITPCIKSLLNQHSKPKKILLWLSKKQFPHLEQDLPEELLRLQKDPLFEIRWVQEDLAPHKKYFYTMREYPEVPVIIVDDDVVYDKLLVGKLMESYRKFPDCISCMRANLMLFKNNGNLRSYSAWIQGYRVLLDVPSFQLLPTGVGGVLYPPKSIPEQAFDAEAIEKTCLYTDDLWLKMFAAYNGYRTVVPRDLCEYKEIEGTAETALWRINVHRNNNDTSIEHILEYFDRNISSSSDLLRKMRQDRFC